MQLNTAEAAADLARTVIGDAKLAGHVFAEEAEAILEGVLTRSAEVLILKLAGVDTEEAEAALAATALNVQAAGLTALAGTLANGLKTLVLGAVRVALGSLI